MKNTQGFTIVEALVAIVILSLGIFALASSSAMVTRTVGGAKWNTTATQVSLQRIDQLRTIARSTPVPCTSVLFVSGGPVTTMGISEQWVVAPNGLSRPVLSITSYQLSGRPRADTVSTRILCY